MDGADDPRGELMILSNEPFALRLRGESYVTHDAQAPPPALEARGGIRIGVGIRGQQRRGVAMDDVGDDFLRRIGWDRAAYEATLAEMRRKQVREVSAPPATLATLEARTEGRTRGTGGGVDDAFLRRIGWDRPAYEKAMAELRRRGAI